MAIAQEHTAAATSYMGVGMELVFCGGVLSFLTSLAGKDGHEHHEVKGQL